jgi:hypothetical protein
MFGISVRPPACFRSKTKQALIIIAIFAVVQWWETEGTHQLLSLPVMQEEVRMVKGRT